MKKICTLIAAMAVAGTLQAQPWLEGIDMARPVILSHILERYEQRKTGMPDKHEEFENGKVVKEGKDYHFHRWVWYWERHLDENGYLVPPIKNWLEARAFDKNKSAHKTTAVDMSNWTFQGPDKSPGGYNGVGRINVIAFHPTDSNSFWIGSAGGGAWRTSNSGVTWTKISDDLPVLGISDIDFNPLNPNTVYMCTGDRDASDNFSVGVLKSINGGTTWDTTGIQFVASNVKLTNSLVINPEDTNSLTLAASDGILKSYDGGASWVNTLQGNFKQLVYHPVDTAILYAAGYAQGTHQVYRSADGGATWQQASAFPTNHRVVVAVTPAAPWMVKAVVANTSNGLEGIYRSADTGKTFTKIFDDGTNCSTNILANNPNGNVCGGQGWYDLSIAISPVDTSRMVVGGVNTWITDDGGYHWAIANQWNANLPGIKVVHADKHYHAYNPIAPSALWECNDGGVYKTYAPKTPLWTDLSTGLGITQFYRNAVSDKAPFVLGGSQDNGSKKLLGTTYSELTGGDGMDCQIDYTNNSVFYTSQQYGELRRTTDGGSKFTDISNGIPGNPKGDWITPFVILPTLPDYLLAGYKQLYYSPDKGSTWSSISNSFGVNIKRIAVAPDSPDIIYVLVDNVIHKTSDFGANWNILNKSISGNVSDILVDPKAPGHLWVTFNGYNTARVGEYDPASGWTEKNEQLPNVPVNCIAIDRESGTAYIGTDIGVYYRDNNVIEWVPFNNGFPTVEVIDLGINYATKEIWAATYGRSMWKSPLHDPSKTTDVGNIPLANNVVTIAPNPNFGRFEIVTGNKALQDKYISLRIVNMNGAVAWDNKVMMSKEGKAMVNADLPLGSYIVEVRSNGLLFAKEKMVVYK